MEVKARKVAIKGPESVADILHAVLRAEGEIDRNKEHFWVVGLNTRNVVQYAELVSLGTLNNALVHPREVFRFAVMKGVASLIVGHNHPSGDITPSDDDIALTRRLVDAGRVLGIEVLDHVIIGGVDSWTSFKGQGLM
jgi:DNA repair protein RadC